MKNIFKKILRHKPNNTINGYNTRRSPRSASVTHKNIGENVNIMQRRLPTRQTLRHYMRALGHHNSRRSNNRR